MATVTVREQLLQHWEEKPGLAASLSSVDHKRIGRRYLVTGFVFFLLGGLEAVVMRAQLMRPDNGVVDPQTYNRLFSMHGTTMIFLFATPVLSGFANYFIPLQLGARDMAFPRLNAFSYWVFLLSGVFLYSSFLTGQVPEGGWFAYVPLTDERYLPGLGMDFWTLGLIFVSIATTAGAINLIVTIFKERAPGMTLARMPLFAWAILVTSCMVLLAMPPLTVANVMLFADRNVGTHFFDVAFGGDPVLWQHLFWVFGHPDVYIIFLPAVGLVSAVLPAFARRPVAGYTLVALATVTTGILGFGVWVHHMFAVGLPQLSYTFFAAASMVIAIPAGIQVFAWLTTIATGRPVVRTPLLFVAGFIFTFVIGGVTGVMFASPPFDQQVTDSYFVVAHFHYVLFGGAVFPIFAAFHYWIPKITGHMLSETLGRLTFWFIFLGFNLTFFPMHIAGLLGMPRRVYTYPSGLGWDIPNLLSTIGGLTLAVGVVLFIVNVLRSERTGPPAGPNPWNADSLEWSVSSPPPPYNFESIPAVGGRSPLWEAGGDADGRTLEGGRLGLGTSLLDAEPEEAIPVPSESVAPLVTAVSLLAAVIGLLMGWPLLILAGAIATVACVAAWLSHAGGRP